MITCGYRQNHRHLGRSLGLPAEILILAITDAITRASPYLVKSLHQQLGMGRLPHLGGHAANVGCHDLFRANRICPR